MKKMMWIILTCVTASCSATKGIITVEDNMQKISLGMTKKKVISVLGHDFEVISSKDKTTTLGYKTSDDRLYRLVFIDDKLNEWRKDYPGNNRGDRNLKRKRPK